MQCRDPVQNLLSLKPDGPTRRHLVIDLGDVRFAFGLRQASSLDPLRGFPGRFLIRLAKPCLDGGNTLNRSAGNAQFRGLQSVPPRFASDNDRGRGNTF